MWSAKILILITLFASVLVFLANAEQKNEEKTTGETALGEENTEGEEEEDAEDEDEDIDRAHGFPSEIDWVDWNEARDLATEQNKPIFLIIHKSWCHACQSLKAKFEQASARKELAEMSQYFIMVNTEDDEEPWEEEYKPDGQYIPRTMFLKSDGELMANIYNTKKEFENYKYYFDSPGILIEAMQKVLDELEIPYEKPARKSSKPKAAKPSVEPPGAQPPAAKPPADEL